MYFNLCLLALFVPLVASLTLHVPSHMTSAERVTITWDSTPQDPPFSLYLVNEVFHDSFAIANNVLPTQGSLDISIPVVPAREGYTLKAVNVGNINDVYSQTAPFSIAATPSSSSVPPSSTGASSTDATSISTRSAPASSSFGTTVTAPSSAATTSSRTTTNSAPGATHSAFNGAATFKMNSQVGALAGVVFSAVAGAAIFIL